MPRLPIISLFSATAAASVIAAMTLSAPVTAQESDAKTIKQAAQKVDAEAPKKAAWVPPGKEGNPIDPVAFHAMVLLDVAGFSPGVIDGAKGKNLEKAVRGFQMSRDLEVTGKLDEPTRKALLEKRRNATTRVKLTKEQVSGPFTYPFPDDAKEQAKEDKLGYRNMLEKVAEAFHTTPATIIALNGPKAMIGEGRTLLLPNIVPEGGTSGYNTFGDDSASDMYSLLNVTPNPVQGDHIVVDKSEGVLRVMSKDDKVLAQFPVTTGSEHDPLPLGTWKATSYALNPPFHYQADLFWDVKDSEGSVKLPPGPNGPVGVAWLDLTKEHYGLHGTNAPETIGYAQSHGCVRLTNWDVLQLTQMMKPGFKAIFQA